ncbi:MAG: bifunctional hydroxymethylpyrimidine kinase/phosphomethylpyrimidine kinase [Acidobacteriaceae bacterium]
MNSSYSSSGADAPSSSPLAVLTIAGFDPSSGAGITADLKTFAAHGLYGASCITSLTVQSTQGVRRNEPVAAALVGDTLACLADDICFAVIKIGMLGTASVLAEVTEFLAGLGDSRPPVVLDPVLRSSSGRELLDAEGVFRMRTELLGLIDWITPNIDELGVLVQESVTTGDQIPAAANRLQLLGRPHGLNIVVTGGHLSRPDDYLLAADGQALWLPGEWVETTSTHGTGCAYSSALASRLALGDTPEAAVKAAKGYVTEALRQAYPIGKGHGPMHHLWPLKPIG